MKGIAPAAIAILLTVASARAADSPLPPRDYSLESWDERHGLPSGRVWAIAQDSVGYLWLGTEAGLVRFDGVRFVPWTSEDGTPLLEDQGVSALHPAADGSLWLGFYSGGFARIRGGRLERFPEVSGSRATFITADSDGAIWGGDAERVYRYADGRWANGPALTPTGLPDAGAFDAHQDASGHLWIATGRGVFVRRSGRDRFEHVAGATEPGRFSSDSNGALWVTDAKLGVVPLHTSHLAPNAGRYGLGHVVAHDRRNTMWLGTRGQGLWRLQHDAGARAVSTEHITAGDGLSSDIVRSVLVDRAGNVWVGTESGLHRFTSRKTTSLTDVGFTWAVESTPDGSLWIATSEGLVRLHGGSRTVYAEKDGLPGSFVRALFRDAHGTLWAATSAGVARQKANGFERVPIANFALSRVISIAVDSHGTVWLCDRGLGAFRLDDGRLSAVPTGAGADAANAQFVYVDRRDRLWLGFAGGTVASIGPDGEARHDLGRAMGSVLTAIHEDHDGNIWVGGTRGLGRIAGNRVDLVSQPDNLTGYGVFSITEDAGGDIWLGVNSGILRLRVGDFEKAARDAQRRLTYRFADASDGLVGVPTRQGFPGAVRRADGTLWFTTSRGATIIAPDRIDEDVAPPPIRIESVEAGGRAIPLMSGAVLPAGTSQLLFLYTALNLTSPLRERFQYRLEGVDADWVMAGTRREAFYSNLRSGRYRFQVARVGDSARESTAAWEFSITPMYYETWWFLGGCMAAAFTIAWAAWQLRLRQLRRQFALVYAERARVSRELHDTLLQDLVGVSLHFDELAATLGGSSPATGQIVRLRRYLERSVAQARHAIWDLRSATFEEGNLPKALQASAAQTFRNTPVAFTMQVHGTPRRCPPAIDEHLLRIGREALYNAARHAEATTVELELDYQRDAVLLRVTDNGHGYSPERDGATPPGHHGLVIMRERAAQAGGRLAVDTSPGHGTRIEVAIPTKYDHAA